MPPVIDPVHAFCINLNHAMAAAMRAPVVRRACEPAALPAAWRPPAVSMARPRITGPEGAMVPLGVVCLAQWAAGAAVATAIGDFARGPWPDLWPTREEVETAEAAANLGDHLARVAPFAAAAARTLRAGYRRMMAGYRSRCSGGCGRRCEPGQWIVWHSGSRRAWHEACAPVTAYDVDPGVVITPRAVVAITEATPAPAPDWGRSARVTYPGEDALVNSGEIDANLRAVAEASRSTSRLTARQQTEAYQRNLRIAQERGVEMIDGATRASARPPTLTPGQIVAGAAAEGHGSLVGWQGRGERTAADMAAALARAGLPAAWGPKSKSTHRHAGLAVAALNCAGFVTRAARGVNRRSGGRDARAVARWTVQDVNAAGAQVGEAAGTVVLVVELMSDESLVCTGDAKLSARVSEAYERTRAGEIYQAGEVTDWLRSVLLGHLGAVRLGGCWYLQRAHRAGLAAGDAVTPADTAAAAGERLCDAMASQWGDSWLLPALPVATTDQLRAGLVRGLGDEIREIGRDVDVAMQVAKEAGREHVGHAACARYLERLSKIRERVSTFEAVLGGPELAELAKVAADLVGRLDGVADGTSIRASLLEWDVTPREPADGGWTKKEIPRRSDS